MTYTIETRDAGGNWSSYGLGDATGYESEEAAERAIESLRALGGEWADGEYRVREVQPYTADLARIAAGEHPLHVLGDREARYEGGYSAHARNTPSSDGGTLIGHWTTIVMDRGGEEVARVERMVRRS